MSKFRVRQHRAILRVEEDDGVPEHVDDSGCFFPYSRCAQIIDICGGDELNGRRSFHRGVPPKIIVCTYIIVGSPTPLQAIRHCVSRAHDNAERWMHDLP
jgi:hypothetical protein